MASLDFVVVLQGFDPGVGADRHDLRRGAWTTAGAAAVGRRSAAKVATTVVQLRAGTVQTFGLILQYWLEPAGVVHKQNRARVQPVCRLRSRPLLDVPQVGQELHQQLPAEAAVRVQKLAECYKKTSFR